ncbi:hypothetical protein DB345_10135 [Spartobacteria bacterium LR76]|nr:hypothetical protein DB345_10135 [Spartobacteria bacterium LR76]
MATFIGSQQLQSLSDDVLTDFDAGNSTPDDEINHDMSYGGLDWCAEGFDSRLIRGGITIPARYYADQPYVVRTTKGDWLCVLTTGDGLEGSRGQHVISIRSEDHGKTWSEPVCIEPSSGPEASWVVPLILPSGRIVVFYVYNMDDIRELPTENPPGVTNRMDSHGHYVFRWSDDGGRTWSDQRGVIPVREFDIDRENSTGGRVRLFWNVGKPRIVGDSVILPLHKVGGFGHGWFTRSEGAFVRSDDLLTLQDPLQASWITLPDGDKGLRTPEGGGPIAEEQCICELSDGSLFSVYRSIDGFPVGSYSRDLGHTWSEPDYLVYADGRRVKHPRAACFVWRLAHGGYVLWFHNHGGDVLGNNVWRCCRAYDDRNPAWMVRGWEIQGKDGSTLVWGNPEIVLYEDDPLIRISYPDLLEEGGKIYLTETQKTIARVHCLGENLACALKSGSNGFSGEELRKEALFEWTQTTHPTHVTPLPPFVTVSPVPPHGTADQRAGFTFECELVPDELLAPGIIARAWHPSHGGFRLEWTEDRRIRIVLSDGRTEHSWTTNGNLWTDSIGGSVIVCVDGGPKIITLMVDGILCDGGNERQFGWGRLSANFRGICTQNLTIKQRFKADGAPLKSFRIYPRPLLSAEMEALFRHQTEVASLQSL